MGFGIRWFSALMLLAVLAGCAGPTPGASTPPAPTPATASWKDVAVSEKPRADASGVPQADRAALAEGNLAFALDLYHAVGGGEGNLFFSPYSISLALAMAYAGAKGETQAQMADTLHFTLPQERLHPAFNVLDQELASRKDVEGQGADGKGFRLNIVNDLWGQKDYAFMPAFLDTLATNYGAGMRLMDYKQNPEGARKAINDYIAEKTEQRIRDLLAQGSVDPQTRLVLTNAIYFNAAWLFPFEAGLTKDAPFTRLDGSTANVPMMHLGNAQSMLYWKGEGLQAVAIPYEGWKISMVVLLPDEGKFSAVETSLDAASMQKILDDLSQSSSRVQLSMPRFQIENAFSLGDTLGAMGMKDAVAPGLADFSGMDGTRDLYISDVVHKAFVKVDEAGTEAAAATAVIMAAGAMPEEPVTLTVDRPFLFLITDQPTGAVLFMGRVTNPQP